jgi:DNA polymerase-3 subunit gamma/tau
MDIFRTFVVYDMSVSVMDNYIVSARKYRPSTFRSVVGQEALTTTLKNAIAGSKLAHAYLFSGPRGVGKTTCARIFAKTINCLNPTAEHEACNECESCVAFNEQRSYNIHELDAASNNSVDDIRNLIDQVRIPPQIGKYKVYIIDEVHMLSQSAFNSFLKTLEEPPAHAIFILATTEKHKIIPTILSRCQVYDFNRIHIGDIVAHLQYVAKEEGVKAEAEALNIIAQKADGGMRDALSIFDQTVSYTGGVITYQAVIENLNVLDYEYYFRLSDAILSGGASIRERYISMAQQCSNIFLYKAIELSNECDLNYRLSKNKRLLLELTLIKLCQLTSTPDIGHVEKKKSIEPIAPKKSDVPSSHTSTSPDPKFVEETVKHQRSNITNQPKEEERAHTESQFVKEPEKQPTIKRTTASIAGMGISLASIGKQKEETVSTKEEVQHKGSNRFSEEELIAAWKSFAAQLTEEVLLKNTMSLYLPRMVSDVLFEVEVNTELNKQYLTDNSLAILTSLRKTLKNWDITMTIRIAEGNAIKKPLTSHEIFEEMVKQNPVLQKLSDEFGLELS